MSVADGSNPWLTRLPILVGAHTVGTVNIVSVLAMAPVISRELDLTAVEFGLFVTSYYAAQAVGSLPAGALTDRFGIGRSLFAGHIAMAISAVLLSLADGYAACLSALFMMGLGYSMNNPSTARGVFDWFPPARRGVAMGIKQVGVPAGGIIAAGNGALVTLVPWQTIMLGIAVAIAVNGLCCLYLIRFHVDVPADQRKNPLTHIRDVLRDPNVHLFSLSNGLLNVGQTNFFGFLTLFLTEAARASQPLAGFALGLAQTASFVARIGWGALSDRMVGRRVVLNNWICGVAVTLLAAMVWVGPGWGLWLGMGLVLALGVTIASFAPVGQAIAVEMVDPRLAASALGYSMVGVHIGGMTGPLIFGWAVDHWGGYDAAWPVTAALVGLGVLILARWFREGPATR
ncbi:MAG: MFS transporter [Rhodospirillaceae bacterium]